MSAGAAGRARSTSLRMPVRAVGGEATHGIHPDPDVEMERLVRRLLELLGEDPDREGLRQTPARVVRSYRELTSGYRESAAGAVSTALFRESAGGDVIVRDIPFHSLCEHHLLPFSGLVHVAYRPDGAVVGLSKIARLVEVYARRLQLQERLTDQIADGLHSTVSPFAVAVEVEARHLCMEMRGVTKAGALTLTRSRRGPEEEALGLATVLEGTGPGRSGGRRES